MADVSPIQTKDNSKLYATAAAAGAGAALGGIGGYMRKPFLEGDKLSDKFIKTAQEKLSDDAKAVMAQKSEVIANEAEGKAWIESLKHTDILPFSDADYMKLMQEDAMKKVENWKTLPEKIKNAKNFDEFIETLKNADSDVADLFIQSMNEDKTAVLEEMKDSIHRKHGHTLSTDILRQVDEAKNLNRLATVIKPYDEEMSQTITELFDPETLFKSLKTDIKPEEITVNIPYLIDAEKNPESNTINLKFFIGFLPHLDL